jgi:hypothetical protein
MVTRRILLPAGLDAEARLRATKELVRKYHRKNLVTTGYVLDVYPDERGWVDLPDNNDDRRCVYYAHIHTRRVKREDRNEQLEIFSQQRERR